MAGVPNELNNLQQELSLNADSVDFIEASQRLLLNQINIHAKNSKDLQPNGYKRFISLEDQIPSTLISKITSQGVGVTPFIEVGGHPVLASARTPKIRIYKVYRDTDNKAIDEVEIPLFLYGAQTVLNPQDRSSEAFFKELSFSLKDQTSFGASRHVMASLSLGFNSFSALNKVYTCKTKDKGEDVPFSYLDLIKRTAGRAKDNASAIRPKAYASYSLRLEIGWNHVASEVLRDTPDLEAASAAGAEFNDIVLILELEDYELDIQQNGMLTLNMSYNSFIDREMSKKLSFDVLMPNTPAIGDGSKSEVAKAADKAKFEAKRLRDMVRTTLAKKRDFISAAEAKLANLPRQGGDISEAIKEQNDIIEKQIKEIEKIKGEGGVVGYETIMVEMPAGMPGNPESFATSGPREMEVAIRASVDEVEKALEDVISSISRVNKIARYASFMNNIVKNGRVYSFDVPKDELLLFSPQFSSEASSKIKDLKGELVKKKNATASKLMSDNSKLVEGGGVFGDNLNKAINDQVVEQAKKAAGSEANRYESSIGIGDDAVNINLAVALGLNKALGKAQNTSAGFSVNQKRVTFIYLGDLIQQAISDDVFKEMQDRKIGLILGNFIYENKINLVDNQQQQSSGGDTKQIRESINFADVPVSIEMFSRFFTETIINKGAKALSLMDFLQGLVNQLIVPLLNQELAGSPVFSPIRARTTFIRANNPILVGSSRTLSDGHTISFNRTYGRLGIDKKEDLDRFKSYTDPNILKLAKASQIWNYLTIYGVETKEIVGLKNSYEKDTENGVYNFVFGDSSSSSTGGRTDLIKDIKFVKVKAAGQREMMVQRQMSGGNPNSVIELWNIFNIEMTMVGNNLFAPGKYIRISPIISGFGRGGNEKSIIQELGLGGYYMVTSVSNDINSSGEWTTNVTAAWQSNGGDRTSKASGRTLTPEEAAALATSANMNSGNEDAQFSAQQTSSIETE